MGLIIKLCGLRRPVEVALAVDLAVDLVGFVLAPSKRQVQPDQARSLAAGLPAHIPGVGVFRTIDHAALTAVQTAGLGWVQGAPVPGLVLPPGLVLLPAIQDGPELGARVAAARPVGTELVLIDGAQAGAGETADWSRVHAATRQRPFVLAGGLHPDNLGAAVRALSPAGVDVSSGIEGAPGVKDLRRMRAFVQVARSI